MEVLKEYLNTVTHEYKCFGGVPKGPDWLEIPEGANFAYMHSFRKYVYFAPNKLTFTSHALVWQRKPAQKNEYLVPQNAGGFMFRTAYDNGYIPEHWIEVPEGAEIMIEQDSTKYPVTFVKSEGDCSYCWWNGKSKWVPICPDFIGYRKILWQRPTLPEALPFIDDEPPAYYGNAIRPKPRVRLMATLGAQVPYKIMTPEQERNAVAALKLFQD